MTFLLRYFAVPITTRYSTIHQKIATFDESTVWAHWDRDSAIPLTPSPSA